MSHHTTSHRICIHTHIHYNTYIQFMHDMHHTPIHIHRLQTHMHASHYNTCIATHIITSHTNTYKHPCMFYIQYITTQYNTYMQYIHVLHTCMHMLHHMHTYIHAYNHAMHANMHTNMHALHEYIRVLHALRHIT